MTGERDRGTVRHERGDVNAASLDTGQCASSSWLDRIRGTAACSGAHRLPDRPVRRDERRRRPARGARSMPRRFRMRPAACSTASRARRRSAACSTTAPAFPRSTIPTARTCSSRSKACRRRTRPRNTASPTTISIRIGDLFAALRSCWSPPPADIAREGMQMSVRFSFKRSGEIIAAPRVTYATAGVPADTRATYLKAINASLHGLPAAEIHRRARRRARRAADRDPLCRQPRSGQAGRRSRDAERPRGALRTKPLK